MLKKSDFEQTGENEIYRIGVIAQFNLNFELSNKALQELLRIHGVDGHDKGSPERSSKLRIRGLYFRFCNLLMLKKHNLSVHIQ